MFKRWWAYQQERFPIIKNGLLIAIFSVSAVCYSVLLRERVVDPLLVQRSRPLWELEGFSLWQTIGSALIAFLVVFLFFLQLRIADEFKDYEDDFRYRPYRPVPRGLITLKELGRLAIAAAAIQLGLTIAIDPRLVLLLLLVWGYMGLMTTEFFAPSWLKANPPIYLVSHMVIMPLITLYATACDWINGSWFAPAGVTWLMVVSFFGGMVIEIGRKMRAPKDEEKGVETYTALWGRQKAVMVWLGMLWLLTLSTLVAAMHIRFTIPVILLLLPLLTVAVLVAWRFMMRPTTQSATWIEWVSGVWSLGVYLSLGLLPLILRH
ncbi:MAG: UbiA family prenyltransferase [Oculatellaceae cyanobacterium bins.114]|nr:UbiA family prenyltransferase [Oculatellaceae cyanobacterium bins.114]